MIPRGAAPLALGALEVGGSHVASARLDVVNGQPRTGPVSRLPMRANGTRDELLATIVTAARSAEAPELSLWGVAVPGPFDYERGICRIRGVAKLDALYGTDLRSELAGALGRAVDRFVFLNDADAFLLGEAWVGAARDCRRAIGITLGTGLGSAFLADGRIAEDGPGVPAEGRLDLLTLDGRPVEASVSSRGLLRTYRRIAGRGAADPRARSVAELAQVARRGDEPATRAFESFGDDLGRVLGPWIEAFRPECLVVGGSMARAWDLFGAALLRECPALQERTRCEAAHHLETAALIGAARVGADRGGP